ncbi:MAG: DUF4838 domain-containing protein [Eubacteriales bacterium]
MLKERGIVLHMQDCGEYFASRLEQTNLNVVGVHPEGGCAAHVSMEACIHMLDTPAWRSFRHRMERAGIAVEFEMHALSWILEREKFETHRDWFRMTENGERTPDFNCCASNPDALAYLSERAALLASIFRPDTGKYNFWIDDVSDASCHCEKCREFSASDQALILYNAIAEGLAAVHPDARESYLAYFSTLSVPTKVSRRENVFLEFAPIARDFDVSLFDESREKNHSQVKSLPDLLRFFGREDAKVLDYWMDNSLFSGWKRPPKKFHLNAATCAADVAQYRRLGFDSITSFGCFLGEDYRDLYGDADLSEYSGILSR